MVIQTRFFNRALSISHAKQHPSAALERATPRSRRTPGAGGIPRAMGAMGWGAGAGFLADLGCVFRFWCLYGAPPVHSSGR
jgi:hypothetical protein